MSAIVIAFKPKSDPRRDRDVLTKYYHSLLGMSPRQEGMAHHLSWGAGMHRELIDAFCGFIDASLEFETALEAYREQLLRALASKCPAAARRITEGKPSRRRKASAKA